MKPPPPSLTLITLLGALVSCSGSIDGVSPLPSEPGVAPAAFGDPSAGMVGAANAAVETASPVAPANADSVGPKAATQNDDEEPDWGSDSERASDAPVPDGPLARNLTLSRVEVNQGVAIAVAERGELVDLQQRNADVIGGRPMLLRVHWEVGEQWQARNIRAVLALQYEGGETEVLEQTYRVTADSDASRLEGTMNWLLAAERVRPGMRYSIALLEVDDGAGPEPEIPPRVPRLGTASLGVTSDPMQLKVVIVPGITATGAPAVTPEAIAQLRYGLFDLYPVQDVELRVHEPVAIDQPGDDFAWSGGFELLRRVCEQDPERDPAAYYALVVNRKDLGIEYSGMGVGVLSQHQACNALSLIFADPPEDGSLSIAHGLTALAHELGHNHGRDHVDCGDPTYIDPEFPYESADLGVQGYSLGKHELRNRGEYSDLMGYCHPRWVSDWLYRHFTERVREVSSWANTQAYRLTDGSQRGHSLVGYLGADEPGRWLLVTGGDAPIVDAADLDSYALLAGERLAVSVSASGDAEVLAVSVPLPGGVTEGQVDVVIGGVRRTIELANVEQL